MFLKKCLLFKRRKISFFIIPLLLISLIFIVYQIVIFVQISNENTKPNLIRGIHEQESRFYIPNNENKFNCIRSLEVIEFQKVNDDYCDCLDGSDEPGTSACPNGLFFCANQVDVKNFRKAVHSSKVNDGICDCCDGSDEWDNNRVLNNLDVISQRKAARFQVPCPKMC
ncbi:glucosidase 2 subunit beta [Anoplophora glabripennis]|uniref:glucosidase 2 subunit beta n=1 Tax=Anoplophora glabripennis TaxID=217634 RepID=UPI00087501E5|nr:glucosidase 2 subunit beta [Anoplophora glabripennis]